MSSSPSSATRRVRRRTGLTRSHRVALISTGALILVGAILVDRQLRSVSANPEFVVAAASVDNARMFMYGVVAVVIVGVLFVGFRVVAPAAELTRDALEDLRIANEQLDAALESAREAAQAKSDFVATMSHELRTPLNAVIGLSGLLAETPLEERQAMYVSTINRSGEALLGLINNILDVSKIEAGKIELEFMDFDLHDVVETTVETMAMRAESQALDLENKELIVTGNFNMNSGSRVKMTQAAAHFQVNGNYTSSPNNDVGDAWMTDGLLEVKGNFTGQFSGPGQSFRAVGNHITRFSGTGAQSISFQYAHEGIHRESFGRVEITNSSASGVTIGNWMRIHGTFNNTGRITIPASRGLQAVGAATLGATSFTLNSGSVSFGSCSAAAGATITGFSCP